MFARDLFDPFQSGAINQPQSLSQELEALRHQIKEVTGKANWYRPPRQSLEDIEDAILNFVSASAPQSNQGTEGSIWIRQNGTSIQIYQRGATSWGNPIVSLSSAVSTNVTLTGGSADPTAAATDGSVYLQLGSANVVLWSRQSGAWVQTLTYDGIAVTAGSAAASGGEDGDIYFQLTGSTFSIHRRASGSWTEQASVAIDQDFLKIATSDPSAGDGSDGDKLLVVTESSIKYQTKSGGSWSNQVTFPSAKISDAPIAAVDTAADYIAFMDAGTAGTPNRRVLIDTLFSALSAAVIPNLPASKITSGRFNVNRVAWVGTQAEYDTITTKDANTQYMIRSS